MLNMKRMAVTAVPVLGLCAPFAATAHAGTMNVKSEIEYQQKLVTNSAAAQKLMHLQVRNASEAKKAIGPYMTLERKYDSAATAVSHASASNSTQRTARTEWVNGVREASKGLGQLVTGFRDLGRGDKTGAKREIAAAEKTLISGGKMILKAEKSLGIKIPKTT